MGISPWDCDGHSTLPWVRRLPAQCTRCLAFGALPCHDCLPGVQTHPWQSHPFPGAQAPAPPWSAEDKTHLWARPALYKFTSSSCTQRCVNSQGRQNPGSPWSGMQYGPRGKQKLGTRILYHGTGSRSIHSHTVLPVSYSPSPRSQSLAQLLGRGGVAALPCPLCALPLRARGNMRHVVSQALQWVGSFRARGTLPN